MSHECHANGCENLSHRMFCEQHSSRLPPVHIEKLESFLDCNYCDAEVEKVNSKWFELANLGIAILCLLDYGDHDCPPSYRDEDGFCWACGIDQPDKTFNQAKSIVKRFRLK